MIRWRHGIDSPPPKEPLLIISRVEVNSASLSPTPTSAPCFVTPTPSPTPSGTACWPLAFLADDTTADVFPEPRAATAPLASSPRAPRALRLPAGSAPAAVDAAFFAARCGGGEGEAAFRFSASAGLVFALARAGRPDSVCFTPSASAGADAEDNGGEGPAGGALPAESARVLAEACPVPADAGATPAAAEACELRAMGGDTGPADAGGDSGSAPQSPPQRRPPIWYR